MKKIRTVFPCDKGNIARSISLLKQARSLLKEVKALKAAAAVNRAIKSADGAYRHAERALQNQTLDMILAGQELRVKTDPINGSRYFTID